MEEPRIDSEGRFVYDTLSQGVWYVMRPKSNLGARAIPNALKRIEDYNKELQEGYSKYLNSSQEQPLTQPQAPNLAQQLTQPQAPNLAQQLTQPQAPAPAPAQSSEAFRNEVSRNEVSRSAALRNEVPRSETFRNEASRIAELRNEVFRSFASRNETSPDFITIYAPRYRKEISVGVFRDCYMFQNFIFVHTTPTVLKLFMAERPYQVFFIQDHTCNSDTNHDEYGNLTHDSYMRISSQALATLFLSIQEYTEDVRIFTAHELQELKYTRQVLIVDGPLKGRVCRIKSIQGKQRIIVDLLEGSLSLVLVMSDTHFQRIKA